MGGGCSRLVVTPQAERNGETNQSKKTVGPNNASNSNVSAIAGNSRSSAVQPLSRVLCFPPMRAATAGIDIGSRSSSAVMRSNSFWLHEDDDRVDEVINRWKAAEILFLQGVFNDYLQTQKRFHPPQPTKGRNQQVPTAAESLRLPVEVLLSALTSKRMFIASSSTLLGITFPNLGSPRTSESELFSAFCEAAAVTSILVPPPLILRLRAYQDDPATRDSNLASPYVCESSSVGQSNLPAPSANTRFSISITPGTSSSAPLKQSSFSQPQRCLPIWGLTSRGLYQALCVQTLAITISSHPDIKQKNIPIAKKTRTFHFHIRKFDGVDLEPNSRREKGDEEGSFGGPGALSIDFKDFGTALAILGGKGSREEMLMFLFLLFAEPLPVLSVHPNDAEDSLNRVGSCSMESVGEQVQGTLSLIHPREFHDTLGYSSSPRDIAVVVGSPRSSWSNPGEKEKEEGVEVLALTQTGLDCLVRFLVVTQAVAAESKGSESEAVRWANSILDIESQDYPSPGVQRDRPLYSFSVRSDNTGARIPLVVCATGGVPITLPMFLSSLGTPSDGELKQGSAPAYPFQVSVPAETCDVASVVFATSGMVSSLAVFMEDIREVFRAVPKEVERDKRMSQQIESFLALAAATSNGAFNEETESKMSLSLPITPQPREEGRTSPNSANSPRTRLSKGNNKSVSPETVVQTPTSSPNTAKKHRKSNNNRVISPSFVVPVLEPSGHEGSETLSPPLEDQDSYSIESAGTGTTVDSLNNPDSKALVGGRSTPVQAPGTSTTFSSSILAALSFSSHGASGASTQDGIMLPNRTRSSTTSVSVHPSALTGRPDLHTFSSPACGLINLGNTCFMSSALQCLVHSPLLKEYFMSCRYKEHLNVRNPLGTKGVLTEEFAALIESMWGIAHRARVAAVGGQNNGNIYRKQLRPVTNSSSSSSSPRTSAHLIAPPITTPTPCFAPHDFKRVLQTCKSQFQGHEQQDVQEFLAELMDALHEDLNRYSKYSVPHTGAFEEAPANTVAASASMAWRKLTGQSGKRVVTLHVAPNVPGVAPAKRKEEKEVGVNSTVSVTASGGSDITEPPVMEVVQPLSLQGQGTLAWEQHLVRNRSCIVDLFQGQLCSQVTCNECGNVSRTFDPFTSLSLPLPVQHDITVIVTMVRRMPRLSSSALSCSLTGGQAPSALATKILAAQIEASELVRLVVVLPRLSDMGDLRKAICLMLSPATSKNASSSSTASTVSADRPGVFSSYPLLPEHLTLLDCHPDGLVRNVLDDRESLLQLIDAISRTTATASTGPNPRGEAGTDGNIGTPSNIPDAGAPKGDNARYRSESINIGSPAAAGQSDPAIKAALENPNIGMVMQCVAVENPKNIPFIFSLSSSRLGTRNAAVPAAQSSRAEGADKGTEVAQGKGRETGACTKKDNQRAPSSSNSYTDELEYQNGCHDASEGDMVTDIDFELPLSAQSLPQAKKEDDRNPKASKNSSFHAWPSSIDGLALGRRVDALDHRGQWFSGTIVDKWLVTTEDLSELSAAVDDPKIIGSPITSKNKKKGKFEVASPSRQGSGTKDKDRNRGPRAIGWNLRIHFDNFSSKWDEWFAPSDFDLGRVARVFSYSVRKLKVIDVVIIQRQIILKNNHHGSSVGNVLGSESPSSSEIPNKLLSVNVFGYPIVLQCESFRSCEHVHQAIAEQSIRYAHTSQMRQMVESSLNRMNTNKTSHNSYESNGHSHSSSEAPLPFTIRIVSTTSALISEGLEGVEACMEQSSNSTSRALQAFRNARSTSGSSLGGGDGPVGGSVHQYSSITDRAYGFQTWEGSNFPRDPIRPLCNLVHPRLLVAVDWHWNLTVSPTPSSGLKGTVSFRDLDSYVKLMKPSIPPSIPMASLSTPMKGENGDSLGSNSAEKRPAVHPDPSATPAPAPAAPSSSPNPTLLDCLKSFTATEDLDQDSWHCDHCKKLCSGSVSSSLSRLPDLLIMHIKRFGMTARFREKIRAKVTFPLSSLDMSPFITPSDEEKVPNDELLHMYDLYAVANHLGGMSGGHYTAMVKCETETSSGSGPGGGGATRLGLNSSSTEFNRSSSMDRSSPPPDHSHRAADTVWMVFDDDVVTPVPPHALEATIITDAAYVLFYRRRQLTSSNIVNLSP